MRDPQLDGAECLVTPGEPGEARPHEPLTRAQLAQCAEAGVNAARAVGANVDPWPAFRRQATKEAAFVVRHGGPRDHRRCGTHCGVCAFARAALATAATFGADVSEPAAPPPPVATVDAPIADRHRLLAIARGCRDYGFGNPPELPAIQRGVECVIAALEQAVEGDTQTTALERIGTRPIDVARAAVVEAAPGSPAHVALWDAINHYAQTCGGDPSRHVYGNTLRQKAVAAVEAAVRALLAAQGGGR